MSRTVGKDFDVRVAVVFCVCGGRRDGSHFLQSNQRDTLSLSDT